MPQERYGLSATFEFDDGDAVARIQRSINMLTDLQRHLDGFQRQQSRTVNVVGGVAQQISRSSQQAANSISRLGRPNDELKTQLRSISKEFRAIRAESRNIDFGDLHDTQAFENGRQQIARYVGELKALESQIAGVSAEERTLTANLKSQQRALKDRASIAENQRTAAKAQQRMGVAGGVAAAGAGVVVSLQDPLNLAREYSKELGSITKLAGDLDTKQLSRDILQLSGNYGTLREDVSGAYAELAASGADFSDLSAIHSRVDAILQVGKALDVSVDKSTALQKQLALTYGADIAKMGGIETATLRAGSSINTLADNLENANVSGQGVLERIPLLLQTIGNKANFPIDRMAALAAVFETMNVDASTGSAFMGRLFTQMGAKTDRFASALGMTVADFKSMFQDDAATAIEAVAKKLGSIKSDLDKRTFLKQLGMGNAEDQAILLGMANNSKMLASAILMSNKAFKANTSIARENLNVQKQSKFQVDRMVTGFANLRTQIGVALDTSLLPFYKIFSSILDRLIAFNSEHPKLIQALVTISATLGAIAAVAGTVGLAIFWLQSAMATAAIGMTTMAASGVPLTGFFATLMNAFVGQGLVAGFTSLGTAIGGVATAAGAIATGPLAVWMILFSIVQSLLPRLNLLGAAFGFVAGVVGAAFGLVEGFIVGIAKAFAPLLSDIKALASSLFPAAKGTTYLGTAIQMVIDSFRALFKVGSSVGSGLGVTIGTLIVLPLRAVVGVLRIIAKAFNIIGYIAAFVFVAVRKILQVIWAVEKIVNGFKDLFLTLINVKRAGHGVVGLVAKAAFAISAINSISSGFKNLASILGVTNETIELMFKYTEKFVNLILGTLNYTQNKTNKFATAITKVVVALVAIKTALAGFKKVVAVLQSVGSAVDSILKQNEKIVNFANSIARVKNVIEEWQEFFKWLANMPPIKIALDIATFPVKRLISAWKGFVDWFGNMPLVQIALEIAKGLINALNHNPTVKIPIAWEHAKEQISQTLQSLLERAREIGVKIRDALVKSIPSFEEAKSFILSIDFDFSAESLKKIPSLIESYILKIQQIIKSAISSIADKIPSSVDDIKKSFAQLSAPLTAFGAKAKEVLDQTILANSQVAAVFYRTIDFGKKVATGFKDSVISPVWQFLSAVIERVAEFEKKTGFFKNFFEQVRGMFAYLQSSVVSGWQSITGFAEKSIRSFMGGVSSFKQVVKSFSLILKGLLIVLSQAVVVLTGVIGFARGISSGFTDGLLHPIVKLLQRIGAASDTLQSKSTTISRLVNHAKEAFFSLEAVGRAVGRILAVPATFGLNVVLTLLSTLDYFIGAILPFFRLIASIFSGVGRVFQFIDSIPFPLIALGALAIAIAIDQVIRKIGVLTRTATMSAGRSSSTMSIVILTVVELLRYINKTRKQFTLLFKGLGLQSKGIGNFAQGVSRISHSLSNMGAEVTGLIVKVSTLALKAFPRLLAAFRALTKFDMSTVGVEVKAIAAIIGKESKNIRFRIKRIIKDIHQVGVATRQTIRGIRDIALGTRKAGKALSRIIDNSRGQLDKLLFQFNRMVTRFSKITRVYSKLIGRSISRSFRSIYRDIAKYLNNTQGRFSWVFGQVRRGSSGLGVYLGNVAARAAAKWTLATDSIYASMKRMVRRAQAMVRLLSRRMSGTPIGKAIGDSLENAANMAAAKWMLALDSIYVRMKRLTRRAQAIGRLLVKRLSENSPGPTFQIRQKWTQTTESIQGQISDLAVHAAKAGKDMAASLGKNSADRVAKLSGGFSQVGSLLSNFAPSLAAPLFVVGDLLDTIDMAKDGLPGLKKGFASVKAATSGMAGEFSRVTKSIPGLLSGVTDIHDVFPGLAKGFSNLKDFKLPKPDWSAWKSSAVNTFSLIEGSWVDVSGNIKDLAHDSGPLLKKTFTDLKSRSSKAMEATKGHLGSIKASAKDLAKSGVRGFSSWLGTMSDMKDDLVGLKKSTVSFARSGLKGFSRWISTIPELTSLMGIFGWTSAAANTTQAATSASATSAIALQTGATVSGTAAMSTGFATMAAAAKTAWATTVAPLLPVVAQFLAVAAAVGGLLAVIKMIAPNFNIFAAAVRPLAYLLGFFYGVLEGLLSPFFDLTEALKGIYQSIRTFVFPAIQLVIHPVQELTYYVYEVAEAFQSSFGTGASLGKSLGKALSNILLPLKLVSAVFGFFGRVAIKAIVSVASAIKSVLMAPIYLAKSSINFVVDVFQGAVNRIQTAWQGFVDWFNEMPLVKFASNIAQGLINALNHNPTVKIPLAWEDARSQITDSMSGLLSPAKSVGDRLNTALDWTSDHLNQSLVKTKGLMGVVGRVAGKSSDLIGKLVNSTPLASFVDRGSIAFGQFQSRVDSVSASVKTALAPVTAGISRAFGGASTTVKGTVSAVDGLVDVFTSVGGAVNPVMSGLKLMFNGLEAASDGNFTQMDEGWDLISSSVLHSASSVTTAVLQITDGVKSAFFGMSEIGGVVYQTVSGSLSLLHQAFETNFLGIRDVVSGGVDWLRSTFGFLSSSFDVLLLPIASAVDRIKGAWSGFSGWFHDLTAGLPGMGRQAGKGLIDALNHNPTVKIPIAWEEARSKIEGSITGLVPEAKSVAGEMVSSFSDHTDQLTAKLHESFNGSIKESLGSLVPEAKSVAGEMVSSFSDRTGQLTATLHKSFNGSIKQSLGGLVPEAKSVAGDMVSSFSDRASQLTANLHKSFGKSTVASPSVASPVVSPSTPTPIANTVIAVDPQPAVDAFQTVQTAASQSSAEVHKSFGGGFFGLLFAPFKLIGSLVFGVVKGIFAVNLAIIHASQYLAGLLGKVVFWLAVGIFKALAPLLLFAGVLVLAFVKLPKIFKSVLDGIKSIPAEIAKIPKVIFGLSGDILGLKTVIAGVFQFLKQSGNSINSVFDGFWFFVNGIKHIIRNVIGVIEGLPAAVDGDFKKINQSVFEIVDSFRYWINTGKVARKFFTDAIHGVSIGLENIKSGFIQAASQIHTSLANTNGAIADFRVQVQVITDQVVALWHSMVKGIEQRGGWKSFDQLPTWLQSVADRLIDIWHSAISRISGFAVNPDLSRIESAKAVFTEATSVIRSQWKSLADYLGGQSLKVDWATLKQLPGQINDVIAIVKPLMVTAAKSLSNAFETAIDKIVSLWKGLDDKFAAPLSALVNKAKEAGLALIRYLSENSPGPTFQIRQKWASTLETIKGGISGLATHAKVAGQQISTQLGSKISDKLSKASGGFTQVGALLSNFAPELAAPLFMVNDVLDTIGMASENMPALKKGFAQLGSAATANSKKLATMAGGISSNLVGAMGSILPMLSGLPAMASAAWAGVILPALPVIGIVAAVGLAIFGLYKAFKSNFLGIRSIAQSVIGGLIAGFQSLLFPIQSAINGITTAWDGFKSWFGGLMNGLPGFARQAGQHLIDALNHNPTVKIPLAWEDARNQIEGSIAGLIEPAKVTANDLVSVFGDRAVQLQSVVQQAISPDPIAPSISSPTVSTPQTVKKSPVITPSVDTNPMSRGFAQVRQMATNTAQQVQSAIANTDWQPAADKLRWVVDAIGVAAKGAAGSMQGLLLSAIGFGLTALAGLSPVVLLVTGLALGAGAVMTNFLGVRTALKGIGQFAVGSIESVIALFEGLSAVVKTSIGVIGGISRTISGIPAAIHGDFSIIGAGVDQMSAYFKSGFTLMGAAGDRLVSGLRTAFGGLSSVGQALIQALDQMRLAIVGLVKFAAKLPQRLKVITDAVVSGWRSTVQTLSKLAPVIRWLQLDRLPGWLFGVGNRLIGVWRSVSTTIGKILFSPDMSPIERARAIVTGVADGITNQWRAVVAMVGALPFVPDASGLERIKAIAQSTIDFLGASWRSLTSMVFGLPLTISWDDIRELPGRVGAIADSLKNTWQGAIGFFNNLIPQIDLSHLLALPDRVGSVMSSIKQSVVSTAEAIAQPFVVAVDKIVGLWKGLTDKIAAPLSGLVDKAKGFGLALIRNLSENSPGPTFQIRQKWAATLETIEGGLAGLTAHAKVAGQQISTQLGDKLSGKLSKVSGGFTQAGALLSNFAPGLAAPLFVVNDVLDTIGMASENLPALKKGFAGLQGQFGKLTGLLPAVGSGLMAIGTSAMAAIAPLLPFIGIAAAIGGAVFLLHKAFKSNFLGIRDAVGSVVNWLRSTFSFLSASFGVLLSPITGAVDTIKGAWSGFKSWFSGLMGGLPGIGQEAGQGLIDALNHNPTVKIPIAWEQARTQIEGSITGLVPQAQAAAGDLVSAFSDRAGQLASTLQQSLGGGVPSPTIAPSSAPMATLEVNPKPVLGALHQVQSAATQTGTQLRQSLSDWMDVQPADQLRSTMDAIGLAAKGAAGSMQGLLFSAIAAGLAALAGLSPVVLVVGGLALAAGAVMTNFMGARTVLKGLGQVATGAIEMAIAVFDGLVATVKTVVGALGGIAQVIGGIPAAIRGDFSQIQAGLDQVGASFKTGFAAIGAAGDRLVGGLRTAFGGLATIGRGFGEAIGQIRSAIRGAIDFAANLPQRLGAIADAMVARWQSMVQSISGLMPTIDWSRFDGLPAWLNGIGDRLIGAWRSAATAIGGILFNPDVSPIERARSVVAAASEAVGSAWRSAVSLVSSLPLVADGSAIERLRGLVGTATDMIGSAWRSLTTVVANLPLTAVWDGIRELPDRVGAIAGSLKTTWQSAVVFINDLIPQIDLSHLLALPDRVGTVMASIKQSVVSTAEAIAQPFAVAVDKIVGLWKGLTDKIAAPLSGLVEKAKGFGLGLIRNLSENSPGPTFQIRQKWAATLETIEGGLAGLTAHAKVAGQQISTQLGTKISGKLSKVSGGFTQAGVLLSNFAPGLAAPLFVVNDVLDTIGMASENLPALKKGFAGLQGQVGKLTGLLPAIGSGLMAIGSSAIAAIAPLLPFIGIAAAIGGAVFLLYKAFKSNFLGIRDAVGGVVGWLRSTFGFLSASFGVLLSPITGAVDTIKGAWSGFKSWFSGLMGGLPGIGQEAGQGLIDALNHNPTVKIPIAWEEARTQIQGSIAGLVPQAQAAAGDLVSAFSDRAGQLASTLQQSLSGSVASPTLAPSSSAPVTTVEVNPQPVLGALHQVQSAATQTGNQLRQSLSGWMDTQPADQLRSVMDAVGLAAKGAAGSMQGLLFSAIAAGVAALAGLSPLVLIVGGLALAAGAVMTNFMGARTVLKGLGQMAAGSIEMAIAVFDGLAATVKMVIGTIKGVTQVVGGIPAAIRGDFSQVQSGLDQIGASFKTGFAAIGAAGDRLAGGLRTVFGGLSTIGRGFGEAIGQIRSAVGGAIDFAGTLPQRLGAIADAVVAGWRSMVQTLAGLVPAIDWSRFDGLPAWLSGVGDRLISAWRSVATAIAGVLFNPDLSPIDRARSVVASASEAVGAAWRSAVSLVGSLPLVADGAAIERVRGLVGTATDAIGSAWRSLTTVVANLPLTAVWDGIRELPDRVGAIAGSLKTTWQSAVSFINDLIPQIDLSHLLTLPDRVGGVMASIKQSVTGTAEGLAAPFIAAVDKIVGLWQGLTDKIAAPLSGLVEKAKGFGLGLIRNLAENSPGPTFQIRQKWLATTEAIAGELAGLAAHAKTTGAQMASGLGDKAAGKLSKLSGGFTQAGVLLSNFAPGLAAPLFVVNDVLDTIGMAQENLPALQKGFSKLTGAAAGLPKRLGAVGSGLVSIAGTGLTSLTAAIMPALASIGTAAAAAWSTLIVPLLPFIGIAAGVVAAVILIRKAFQSNFLGLRDIVDRVMGAIASAGTWVAAPFRAIGGAIAGAIDKLSAGWERVRGVVGGVLSFLPGAAKETGGQLVDALNHNPTVRIPIAWEAAGNQIAQTMGGLVDRATVVAGDLTDRLTLAPQITPQIVNPAGSMDVAPKAGPASAITVPVEVKGTQQLTQVKSTIQTVSQSAGQFARNTMAAIGSLPEWGQKAKDAIASVGGQFAWATTGAIGFGLTALAGLSPVVLVAGALALAAGAVMTNFLGARTIVKGLGQVAAGSIEMAIAVFDGLAATVKMVIGTIKGITQVVGGIPAAIRGDFSQVQAGLDQIGASFKTGFAAIGAAGDRLVGGLRTAFGGLATIGRGFMEAIDQIGGAVRGLIALVGGLPQSFNAASDRLVGLWRSTGELLTSTFDAALATARAGFDRLTATVQSVFAAIGARVDGLRQSVGGAADAIVAPFVGAIEKIGALWSGLTDRVGGFFGKLTGKARGAGQELVSALAENSPGPTFLIRQKWAATTEAIGGHLSELVADGRRAGGQLAASLGDKVAGKLGKISGGFTQIGVLLSNVSPALAAPFFVMNDILDSAGMVAENLPALQKGLGKVGAVAGKLPALLSGVGSTLVSVGGSLLALAGPVAASIGSALVPVFGAVATAAGAAWSAVIAPALPFIGVAAAIVAAVWLIKKAFDMNFLGIRDLVTKVFKAIGAIANWLLTPFRAIGQAIQGAIGLITSGWNSIKGAVSGVLGFLPGLAAKAGEGLVNALNHNPTVKIPIAWDGAQAQVANSIQSMVPVAEMTGAQMAAALSSEPVIRPVVAAPVQQSAAPPTAPQAVPMQPGVGGASFLTPISDGISGVVAQFDRMRSAANDAIGSIVLQPVTGAIASMGETVGGAIKTATDGIGKLSGGFMQLAVAALPSLLPVGLALGGIALVAIALSTNFLGLRTIATAVFDGIRGAINGVKQVMSGIAQIVQGVINVFKGLGGALNGDFSLIQIGLTQIRSGFDYVFGGLGNIIRSGVDVAKGILSGFNQAVRQVWSVVKQFLGPAGDWIESIFGSIGSAIQGVLGQIEKLLGKLKNVGQSIANSPLGKMFGGGKGVTPAPVPAPADAVEVPVKLNLDDRWDLAMQEIGGNKALSDFDKELEGGSTKLDKLSSGLNNLGVMASAIAPQLAGPINAVSGFLDGFLGLVGLIPQLSSAMSVFGLTASAANTAQSTTAGLAAGATVAQTGVTVSGTAAMSTGFAGLATAAGAAWAAITGPLLPIIAGIALIGGVIFLISKNVWGLGDAFQAAWRSSVEPFWMAIHEATSSIRTAFMSIGFAITETFGIRAVGPLNLFGKLAAGVFTLILLPIRILAIALGFVIRLVAGLISAILYGVAAATRVISWPVSLLLRGMEFVQSALWGLASGLADALLRPMQVIWGVVSFVGSAIGSVVSVIWSAGAALWTGLSGVAKLLFKVFGSILGGPVKLIQSVVGVIGRLIGSAVSMAGVVGSAFSAVAGLIGSAFNTIWSLIPAPLRWLLEQAAKGLGWLMSAVSGGGGQQQGGLEPQKFAVGGLVTGPGGSKADRVPALLSAGEFVVNAAAASANLPFLAAMNAGRAIMGAGDSVPEAIPMPVPMPPVRPVTPSASSAMGASASGSREVSITLNFGGITLQGSPTEAAEQFKNEILYDEQFQRAVRDALRDLVEFSK